MKKAKLKKAKLPAAVDMFTSPDSSNVEGGTFDQENGGVVLAFRDKKRQDAKTVYYYYKHVLPGDWQELKAAYSKGTHIRKVFGKKYRGVLMS